MLTPIQVLNHFKKVIIPGIYGKSWAMVVKDKNNIVKVGTIYVSFLSGLEEREFITSSVAQSCELNFVDVLKRIS